MDIYIIKPVIEDSNKLVQLFKNSITDAFVKENINDPKSINTEYQTQINRINRYFEDDNNYYYYLTARNRNKILGTIAYGPASDIIVQNYPAVQNIPEIMSVYIMPRFQRMGIGSLLFNSILITLLCKDITEFCLDSGYHRAQQYWIKKLGDPVKVLEDYWNKGGHHMIWHKKIKDITIKYKLK